MPRLLLSTDTGEQEKALDKPARTHVPMYSADNSEEVRRAPREPGTRTPPLWHNSVGSRSGYQPWQLTLATSSTHQAITATSSATDACGFGVGTAHDTTCCNGCSNGWLSRSCCAHAGACLVSAVQCGYKVNTATSMSG
jgi:hypothetical protein